MDILVECFENCFDIHSLCCGLIYLLCAGFRQVWKILKYILAILCILIITFVAFISFVIVPMCLFAIVISSIVALTTNDISGQYPCSTYLIYRYAFPCVSIWGLGLEIFTWHVGLSLLYIITMIPCGIFCISLLSLIGLIKRKYSLRKKYQIEQSTLETVVVSEPCSICNDEIANIKFIPCNHINVCTICYLQNYAIREKSHHICSTCKEPINEIQKI